MKYRMKKDLPWMKAGEIFWFENGYMKKEGATLAAECYEATKNYFFSDGEGNFDEKSFEDDEWIERVPRELYAREYSFGIGRLYNTKEEAEECGTAAYIGIIKFREVEE